jgi:hypothetical protein
MWRNQAGLKFVFLTSYDLRQPGVTDTRYCYCRPRNQYAFKVGSFDPSSSLADPRN